MAPVGLSDEHVPEVNAAFVGPYGRQDGVHHWPHWLWAALLAVARVEPWSLWEASQTGKVCQSWIEMVRRSVPWRLSTSIRPLTSLYSSRWRWARVWSLSPLADAVVSPKEVRVAVDKKLG